MATVTVRAARTNLSRLIERALAGEEVIITRGGQPVARLVALDRPTPRRVPGTLRGTFTVPASFFERLSGGELEAWDGVQAHS